MALLQLGSKVSVKLLHHVGLSFKKILEEFDGATIKFKFQVESSKIQLETHHLVLNSGHLVEDLVNKR